MEDIIKHCFTEHAKLGEIKFSYEQYEKFWVEHKVGDEYRMVNRDKTSVICKVAYYPLPDFADLRALIEIKIKDGTDFREVPVHYLERIKK